MSFAIPAGNQPPIVVDMATGIDAKLPLEQAFEQSPAAFFKMLGLSHVSHALGGPEIGSEEPAVRVQDSDQRHVGKVVSLGEHLGADQNVDRAGPGQFGSKSAASRRARPAAPLNGRILRD